MAGCNRRNWEELNITKEEVENLKEALKKEEFRKLLSEYAEEITDPKNRKLYQDEIIQLEAERGVDCTFVNPEPGFVVKTSIDGKQKAFVNICKSNVIGRPSYKSVTKNNSKGLNWSIPFSQSPGREDHDKSRKRCFVYDVVFHPDTLHLAEKSSQFKNLVVDTALSAIEESYKVKLDKKNLRFPKLRFKGIPFATVIRKKSKKQPVLTEDEAEFQKNLNYPPPPPVEGNEKPVVRNFDNAEKDNGKYTIPKYTVKHRTGVDLQEFTYDKHCKINVAIPKELVIEINLPLLNSTKEVTLDVTEKSIHLACEKPAKYKLDIQLPYSVNEEEGNAKFDKDTRILIVTLPVIKSKTTVADLMREDSGVESDFGDRCTSCDDSSPVGSVTNNDNEMDELENASDNQTPQLTLDFDNCNTNKNVASEKKTETDSELWTKEETPNFLDDDKLYILPSFKCNVDNFNLCFILDVKNVDPESVIKKFIGSNAFHVKFTSLGSGFYPVFYSFFVKFEPDCVIEDMVDDVWDNNIILQLFLNCSKSISNYYVGLDENSLTLKDLSDTIYLERKLKDMKLNPHVENDEDDDDDDNNDDDADNGSVSINIESADAEEVVIKIKSNEKENMFEDKQVVNENSTEKLSQIHEKKLRTVSESVTDEVINFSPIARKSILKNRICRSLSESNAEDYVLGSSVEASEGSDLCILGEPKEPVCSKKVVRFNNRIRKQIFKANSSILAQKKKNQKRSRNKRKPIGDRRTSESENSECEEKGKGGRDSENPLIEELKEKTEETNCDMLETVISEENENPLDNLKNEIRFMAKKDDEIFKFKSDLIFDLDL